MDALYEPLNNWSILAYQESRATGNNKNRIHVSFRSKFSCFFMETGMDMWRSVCLSGGVTKIKNFDSRLQAEMNKSSYVHHFGGLGGKFTDTRPP